jgi:hypothetical protein
MNINRALLEASDITKHFMTREERAVKMQLCQLLIDRGHRKYAERFWKLDFNIISSKKHPEFTAAISFDEATVFLSDGFLGSGQGIFNQLDVLLRHEMAHNLMMHQIRMMYIFKKLHANDPDDAYEHISYSSTLHDLLNIIEDYEISNKRYSAADKDIVRNMMLNGKIVGGLVTEDDRGWEKLSLEQMYEELSKELIKINSDIRSDPYWRPRTQIKHGEEALDSIDYGTAKAVSLYNNVMKPSGIKAPIDIFMKSKIYKDWPSAFQKLVKVIYEEFKDFTSDPDKQLVLDIISDIAITSPQETFKVKNPKTGKELITLYTPENKLITADILKNIIGNINYDPLKFNVKRKNNSQEYKDAWNEVIKQLDSKKFDDETLQQLRNAIETV